MNNREALQALLDGKKIRSIEWADKDKFLYFVKDQDCIVDTGLHTAPFPMFHSSWEIYEEPEEAMFPLKYNLEKLTRRVEELENQIEKTLGWIPR